MADEDEIIEGAEFQSSSGPKAGCHLREIDTTRAQHHVSILIRPEGRMPRGVHRGRQLLRGVSILIRPEGRMPPYHRRMPLRSAAFQSSSGPKAGCHPPLGDKENIPLPVSILIRPEGRMPPIAGVAPGLFTHRFNPHPARRPDATLIKIILCSISTSFNPHPARRPDATRLIINIPPRYTFQSSSGPKAGCHRHFPHVAAADRTVCMLSRHRTDDLSRLQWRANLMRNGASLAVRASQFTR